MSLADATQVQLHSVPLINVGHKLLKDFKVPSSFEEFIDVLNVEIGSCAHEPLYKEVAVGKYQFFLYHVVSSKHKSSKKTLTPANAWSHGGVPNEWRKSLLLKRHLIVVSPTCRNEEVGINFSRGEADKLSSFVKTEPSQVANSSEVTDLTADEEKKDNYF